MKICWFGSYDAGYARNKILIDGLRANGVEIIECNANGRGLRTYLELLKKCRSIERDIDYIYCAFPIHFSIFITLFSKKPVIADVLVSLYDSSITDRRLHNRFHPIALLLRCLDMIIVKLADIVIVDTEAHKQYFSQWCNESKIAIVPVGVHTGEFFPISSKGKEQEHFVVQFHGSYIPLQGIEKIVAAASLLRNDHTVHFRLIGNGQEYARIHELVQQLKLPNITFLPWLSIPDLNIAINEADIVLGIFGDSAKVDRIIPNKLFQGLAAKKPVITKDTVTIRRYFSDQEICLTQNYPEDIARTIKTLQENSVLREKIGAAGYHKVTAVYNHQLIARELLKVLQA